MKYYNIGRFLLRQTDMVSQVDKIRIHKFHIIHVGGENQNFIIGRGFLVMYILAFSVFMCVCGGGGGGSFPL